MINKFPVNDSSWSLLMFEDFMVVQVLGPSGFITGCDLRVISPSLRVLHLWSVLSGLLPWLPAPSTDYLNGCSACGPVRQLDWFLSLMGPIGSNLFPHCWFYFRMKSNEITNFKRLQIQTQLKNDVIMFVLVKFWTCRIFRQKSRTSV